jgi:lipopolysaccharide/colanic/teichoic acid biosynthesis glycosyltransferase
MNEVKTPVPYILEEGSAVTSHVASHPTYEAVKRLLDVIVSVLLLVLFAPVFVIVAVAIKLDSAGPVLFAQTVVGLHGRQFRMRKFRSMHPGAQDETHRGYLSRNVLANAAVATDGAGKPIFKTAMLNPARITRVGRLLRRTSLDELPQLWSVLVGDMSLVGPRPSIPMEVSLYEPWQRERLVVKPGLTGLYQIVARNRVPVEEMVRLDIKYIRSRSIAVDLLILLKTPVAMFNGM